MRTAARVVGVMLAVLVAGAACGKDAAGTRSGGASGEPPASEGRGNEANSAEPDADGPGALSTDAGPGSGNPAETGDSRRADEEGGAGGDEAAETRPAPKGPCNPIDYPDAYASHPEREMVGRSEVRKWYAPRPVLVIPEPQRLDLQETLYAKSCKGGRRGGSGDRLSAVNLILAPAGIDPDAETWSDLMTKGAYELMQFEEKEKLSFALPNISRPVKVRGHDGSAMKLPRREGSPEVCMVSWAEPSRDKHLIYTFRTEPRRCDDNSAVELANRLTELRA